MVFSFIERIMNMNQELYALARQFRKTRSMEKDTGWCEEKMLGEFMDWIEHQDPSLDVANLFRLAIEFEESLSLNRVDDDSWMDEWWGTERQSWDNFFPLFAKFCNGKLFRTSNL
jgi:hypothetical protein